MIRISTQLRLLPLLGLLACESDPLSKDAIVDTGNTETGETAPPPIDADEDGYNADEDCDDTNAAVNPGASEICDGIDNDCDTLVDDADDSLDATTQNSWYRDADADGYGNESDRVEACDAPAWYVEENAAGFDCDDTDPAYHPGANEADCTDPNDYNCDGSVAYADADNDGWAACLECNDADPAIHPDVTEICDEIDNDCDGEIDDADASLDSATATHWYADSDSDGFGDADNSLLLCTMPSGYLADNTDCDDSLNTTFPGADEYCDGVDSDCDGTVDEDDALDVATWYADSDSDGYGDAATTDIDCNQPSGFVADNTDCDDTDNTAYPTAPEVCDGVDNDCLGDVDEGYTDTDGDGLANCVDPDVWSYDFNTGSLSDWTIVNLGGSNSPNWNISGGYVYEMSNASHSLLIGPDLGEMETWTFSADAYIGGVATDYLGLVFDYVDSNNFWVARVNDPTGYYGRFSPTGRVELYQCASGSCSVVASDSSIDFTLAYNAVVALSVSVDGSDITVNWDGTDVLTHSVSSSTLGANGIGFFTWDNDSGSYYGSPMVTNP